jgi:hypothetical protein
VFPGPLDRLDDQVQFVRAVDLSRHTVVYGGSAKEGSRYGQLGRIVLAKPKAKM